MVLYSCECCSFSSKLFTDYKRHLKTKKHIKNITIHPAKNIEKEQFEPQMTPNEPKKTPNDPVWTPKKHEKSGKTSKPTYKNYGKELNPCRFCDKIFSTNGHLLRHLKNSCKKTVKTAENKLFLNLLDHQKKIFDAERNELYKHIDKLLKKVGDTITNNNTENTSNNIQLNSYGNEDLSHITNKFKNNMLKIPYGAIPKLIEAVHFNDRKPENKNILLTNKRDNKIKIFSGDKWIYKNKDDTLNNLIDGKYFILDNHYEDVCNKFKILNYEEFRDKFDEDDKAILAKLKQESELVLLNNR